MQWLFGNSNNLPDSISNLSPSTVQGRGAPEYKDNSFCNVEGNQLYKQQRYQEAILAYTNGINACPTAVLYSNRSAAFTALCQYQKALDDAEEAIKIDPLWPKTYSRKGKALYGLHQYKKAADAYSRGLALSLKGAVDEARQRDIELEAVKKQTDNQTKAYIKALDDIEALKKQITDYELLFGEWMKKSS